MVTSPFVRGAGFRLLAPLAALGIAAAVVIVPARAQAPGGEPPPEPPGFGGPPFGGGPFGGGAVAGTIRQINAGKRAVQVQPAGQQGDSRWVVVSDQATVTRHVKATLAD